MLGPTKNFLSPSGFRFVLQRAPHVEFFSQDVSLPSVDVSSVDHPVPMRNIKRHGTKMEYAPLTINFGVDEEMENYKEILNWIRGLAPMKPSGHADLIAGQGITSDATLIILTSHQNEGPSVIFTELWPTSLSELSFRTTDVETDPLIATATFQYNEYYFKE